MNILIVGLLLIGAVEAQAVDYKSTYKGSDRGIEQMEYKVAATATAPTATFQSTSAMPVAAVGESTLNADGTVNAEAYGVGQQESPTRATGRPGQVRKGWAIEGDPIGDALWPLMVMALLFAAFTALRRKRSVRE